MPSFGAADSGSLAYTHGEPLLAHREQRGVCKSHANLDFAQASQDRRSVLRIVYKGMHDSSGGCSNEEAFGRSGYSADERLA